MIYFDNASTTPIDNEILQKMHEFSSLYFANPSSQHQLGYEVRKQIEKARLSISNILNVQPDSIYFNSGATEGNNTIIKGYVISNPKGCLISTKIEHSSIDELLMKYQSDGYHVEFVKTDQYGYIDEEELKRILIKNNGLVIFSPVNHELGTVQNIKSICGLIKNLNSYIHLDLTQTLINLPLNLTELSVDSAAFSVHKINGPKGVGVLYKNNKLIIEKFMYGGNQERKFRSGTENTMGIYGAALAINKLKFESFDKELPNYLLKKLNMLEIIHHVNSDIKQLSSIVSITFPKIYAQTLIESLSQLNVYVSSGSACKQGEKIPSKILLKSGYSEEHALCTIRVSFGKINSKLEIDIFMNHLKNTISKISKINGG